jgi:5-methyltetrahydropteroyltriglutamate--homocysteine methyltransferase
MTVPGPMTITDTSTDVYYNDDKRLGAALAAALNEEILALANAGCTWIQVDAGRLIAAPDCGLGYLDRKLALAKLANMVSAAKSLGD